MKIRLFDEDGDDSLLEQLTSARGVPICLACGKRVPLRVRQFYEQAYFCSDLCGVNWARWAARQIVTAAPNTDFEETA